MPPARKKPRSTLVQAMLDQELKRHEEKSAALVELEDAIGEFGALEERVLHARQTLMDLGYSKNEILALFDVSPSLARLLRAPATAKPDEPNPSHEETQSWSDVF